MGELFMRIANVQLNIIWKAPESFWTCLIELPVRVILPSDITEPEIHTTNGHCP